MSASSRAIQGRQAAFSAVVGLLAGGAQRTAAPMRTPISACPSPAHREVLRAAMPARWRAAHSQSPERSPVNMRPVRFAPLAAGASPTT